MVKVDAPAALGVLPLRHVQRRWVEQVHEAAAYFSAGADGVGGRCLSGYYFFYFELSYSVVIVVWLVGPDA